MTLQFVLLVGVLCALFGALGISYQMGMMRGLSVVLSGEITVNLNGSNAVALDGTVRVRNGGLQVPEGTFVFPPRPPRPQGG
jgi:hypothetical protein